DRHHRREDLLVVHLQLRPGLDHHGRLDHAAPDVAAEQALGPGGARLGQPRPDPLAVAGADQRAESGGLVERVADFERAHLGHEAVHELLEAGAWTKTRWTLMQLWPAYEYPPTTQRSAANARSASEWTITPALPPSSSVTRLRPARRFISQPTTGEPVNVSSLKRSSSTSAAASLLFIGSTLSAAAGQPASRMIPASVSAEIGVCEAGLSTTGQPAAIAGASLCATRFSGKLNGEIAAIGPIGKRRTRPWRPSPPGVASRCSSSS